MDSSKVRRWVPLPIRRISVGCSGTRCLCAVAVPRFAEFVLRSRQTGRPSRNHTLCRNSSSAAGESRDMVELAEASGPSPEAMKRKSLLPILVAIVSAALFAVPPVVYLCATSEYFVVLDGHHPRDAGSLTEWRARSCLGFQYDPKEPYWQLFERQRGCDTSRHFSRNCVGVPIGAWQCRVADEDAPSRQVPCQ